MSSSKPTKAETAARQEAIAKLREWIKPGDTIYTILDHVSSSGMSRAIRVVVPYTREDGTIDHLHPNYAIGTALGLKHWKRQGREQDALVVGGCGMDMGFHLVYELSSVLYGGRRCGHCDRSGQFPDCAICAGSGYTPESGYPCLGKGKCPSNYHVNHHDRIHCEGTRVYNPDEPDTGTPCWRPNSGFFGPRVDVPEDWPRSAPIDLGNGETYPGHLLTVVDAGPEERGPYVVCPTCGGAGDVANPEGPERWDLRHHDGYAVRHRWL